MLPPSGRHLPLGVISVEDDQPVAMLTTLLGGRLDVSRVLSLQRRIQHLPCPSRTICSSSDPPALDATASWTYAGPIRVL